MDLLLKSFKAFLALTLMSAAASQAADFGVLGKTYKVKERSIIESINAKIKEKQKSGELNKKMIELRDNSKNYIKRPPGIALPVATEYSAESVGVSFTLKEDLTDEKGNIIHRAGKTVNPLEIQPLRFGLCFIDGDDKKQIKFAKEKCAASERIVLVNGNFADVGKAIGVRVFFDQKSTLVHRFGIKQVPTVIRQSGNVLMKEVFVP